MAARVSLLAIRHLRKTPKAREDARGLSLDRRAVLRGGAHRERHDSSRETDQNRTTPMTSPV